MKKLLVIAALTAAGPSIAAEQAPACSVPVSPALFRTGLPLVGAPPAPAVKWPKTMVRSVNLQGAPAGETLNGLAQAVGVDVEWSADDELRNRPLIAMLGSSGTELSAEQALKDAAAAAGMRVDPVPGRPGAIKLVSASTDRPVAPVAPAVSLLTDDAAAAGDIAAMASALERGASVKKEATARPETGGLVLDAAFVTVRAHSGRLNFAQLASAGNVISAGVEGAGGAFVVREASNGATERWLDRASEWRVVSRQRLALPYGYRLTGYASACGSVRSPAGGADLLDVAQIEARRTGPGKVELRARVGFDDVAKLAASIPLQARPGDRLLVLSGDPRGGWQTGVVAVVRVAEAGVGR